MINEKDNYNYIYIIYHVLYERVSILMVSIWWVKVPRNIKIKNSKEEEGKPSKKT